MDSIVNHLVSTAPEPGHRITFARLDGDRSMDLTELYARSADVARHLRRQGIRPGDRVGILSPNRLEWVLLDLAALRLKAVTCGFESGKFDASAALLAKYDLAVLYTDRIAPTGAGAGADPLIRDIAELADVPATDDALGPVKYETDDHTTIKFTSGSTGEPKGLAASVGSIDSSITAVQGLFHHTDGDDLFVFLPLSLLQQRYWIYSALVYGHDVTVSTYEAAFSALKRVRPTVVMGVPGFFETAKKQIEGQVRRSGAEVPSAARLLFGDRIRYLWTGSAPASAAVLTFFNDTAGLPLFEGFGLNETCIVSKNHPGAHRQGSVGQVLPGKEILLDEDGVVSVRMDYPVNTRYEYATPEAQRIFQPGGIVRTGDLGYVDEDGFLYIRGRADDVIVLDNGKKVIVRPIEERMRTSPAIEECVLFCPTQTYLVAVVSPARQPADTDVIAAHLAAANAALAKDERIRKVIVAEPGFTIDNGLLTSQYKPRRQQIFERFRSAILDNQEGIHA